MVSFYQVIWFYLCSNYHYFGEGNSNPVQYSFLENLKDRGPWQATVHGVAKSQTWLNDFTSFSTRRITPWMQPLLLWVNTSKTILVVIMKFTTVTSEQRVLNCVCMLSHFSCVWLFPTQGLNPHLMFPASAGRFFTTSATWEAPIRNWSKSVNCSVVSNSLCV